MFKINDAVTFVAAFFFKFTSKFVYNNQIVCNFASSTLKKYDV